MFGAEILETREKIRPRMKNMYVDVMYILVKFRRYIFGLFLEVKSVSEKNIFYPDAVGIRVVNLRAGLKSSL